ncbi:MAG: response regulator transcription factor [Selenomonadaceae bacterium]|jgi:Response regulator containing a CheY-like receiver domain and an HTH DNA-binding domain
MRIVLADDHAVLRAGLKLLLDNEADFTVVGEAANGQEVLAILENTEADVLLLDLSMPVMSGLECLREIKSRNLAIKVLVLTMYQDEQYIKEAMQLGAGGYLEKNSLDTELFQALRTVAKGDRYLREQDTQVLLDKLFKHPEEIVEDQPVFLSKREKEVLELLVRGYSLGVIADMLYLSIKTVSTYKTRLMIKLNCSQKSELVDYALKHKILFPKHNDL